jgi:hypothetical protein
MSSDVATVNYDYDAASRMESETQTISGVTGEFTFNYTYKPGGALQSIEDPFERVVTYSYSKTGQLSAVSGTGYPNVSSFISSQNYRAWSARKTTSYGNGVHESTEFNERMLPTAFDLEMKDLNNQTYMDSAEFDYYADGRLYHSFYATGLTKFDRKFEYDFAGRIKEAYTGVEAHNQSPANPRTNPYRQSFQYDAFGNMTQRSGWLWRTALPADSPTYINNRRSDYNYDDSGNVVYTDVGGATFDSAGRQLSSTPLQFDDLGSGNYRMFNGQINHTSDGDGWIRKRVEYRYVEESIGESFGYNEETTTSYNLWSTVLGAVVAELDDEGNQKTGFVYAGGQIARLEITPSSSSVEFQYMSPATGTIFGADSTGIGGRRIELDSMGAEIPKTDPYISNQRLYADLKPPGHMFINGGDPYRFDMGCSLDGLQADCSLARRLTQSGALAQLDENGRPVDIVNLGPGLYGRATQYWVADPDKDKLDPNLATKPGGNVDVGDVIVTNTDEDDRRGHYIDGFEFLPVQDSSREPLHWLDVLSIGAALLKMSKRGRCQEFITKLLQKASEGEDTDDAAHTNIVDLFVDVFFQGGFTRQRDVNGRGYSTVSGAIGARGARPWR